MIGRPLPLAAYLAVGRAAEPLARLLLRRRMRRGGEDPARIGERRGFAGRARPAGGVIWLHGASLGETMSMLPLIASFGKVAPGAACLVTSGTVASAGQMANLLPDRAVHQYAPVDTAASVRRFLDHWAPDMAIFIESEFWPCLMVETARRDIPMALVNARISAASARRWSRARRTIAHMLGLFGTIVTQDRKTGERMAALGADPARVRVGGNLKALVRPPDPPAEDLDAARRALGGRPVWLAASTHPGEEAAALDAHRRLPEDALLILAPRHAERGDAVADMIKRRGFAFARASRDGPPTAGARVWLADAIGRMGLWLRLASATFVGGSLVPAGGHTPFEPAQCGSAILHGPHTENFGPAYARLAEAGGAVAVSDAADLARGVGALLADDALRGRTVEAAKVLFRDAPDAEALARRLAALAPGLGA